MQIAQTLSQETSDDQLATLLKNGETRAIDILIKRHRLFVTRIASRFLFSHEDTREVVQDTFIRVWKNIRKYDNRNRFTTWLYAITFNLCLDRMKSVKKRRQMFYSENEWQSTEFQPVYDDPAGDVDKELIERAIQTIARELGERQRIVFILRDIHDMPVNKVCQITGFDPVKVKTNLYYARKYIREKLVEGGYI